MISRPSCTSDETVQPIAQPHRRIPFHVRKQLEQELKRDEQLGVIERVEGATHWVSSVMVVPKPKSEGQIRVCVDMRQASQAVIRERHITPTINEKIRTSPCWRSGQHRWTAGCHQLSCSSGVGCAHVYHAVSV